MFTFLSELKNSFSQFEVNRENTGQLFGIVSTAGVIGYCLWKIRPKHLNRPNANQVIFITGCDSGLGYNLALKCHSFGLTVLAGCFNEQSDGVNKLKELIGASDRFHIVQIDITDSESIKVARQQVETILKENDNKKFYGLINNAGVMIFGEFEWQTENIIAKQINTNLIGTMMVTKEFLPLLRHHQGRIITITSHCSIQSLPGLAPYGATKAGLRFWLDVLRMEMKQYGVQVINFIPGSFWASSNLMARQVEYSDEMRSAFTSEQTAYYSDYFDRYNAYLKLLSYTKPPEEIDDKNLFEKFYRALMLKTPAAVYIHEPLRYRIYHFLFRISPMPVRDWLVTSFMIMPKYRN